MATPRMIPGNQLQSDEQVHVLRAFVHRYTAEHVPEWVRRGAWKPGVPYPVQFASDQDWLQHTLFAVRTDGRLDRRVKCCESHPTWPKGIPAGV